MPYTLVTPLPPSDEFILDPNLPLCISTDYFIHAEWKADIRANRVLVLSPSHYREFPVTQKVIDFTI